MTADGSADYSYSAQSLPGEGTATDKVLGLPTVVKKKDLTSGSSIWLTTTTFYDKRYNPIQVQTGNLLFASQTVGDVYDLLTNVIDFGGRLNERKEYHRSTKTVSLTIRNSYTYDKMNRLTEVKQGINGGSMIIVGHYEYNSLGQLVDKKLHSTNSGSTYLQSVDYRYNIRGQLTSINNSTLSNDSGTTNDETNDVWGMNLIYEASDAIGNTPTYTGMLSGVKWKAVVAVGNNDERSYIFNYDKLNRLTGSYYKAKTGSTWTKEVGGYNEETTYDWNGNILTMKRNAVISGTVSAIDDVSYSYGTDDNKLSNVTESSSNVYGFRNITSSSSGYTYTYGNLSADAKKGTTITYNEMNKPVTITQTSTGKYIQYSYDAAGTRLTKKVYDGSTTKTYYYIAGLVYDGTTLSYFAMAEGRVRHSSGTFTYEYFITDQQGNVRVSFEDNGSGTATVSQETSYYPFGMLMPGNYMPANANKRLYNAGSEWQDDIDGLADYYSTFFREYDPTLGRFNSVDPQAEATDDLSAYHYSGNNPINFNDPIGSESSPSNANYLLQWAFIYGKLSSSEFGGSWSPENKFSFFKSDAEVWASEGVKNSFRLAWGFETGDEVFEKIAKHLQKNWSAGNKLLKASLEKDKIKGYGLRTIWSGLSVKGEYGATESGLFAIKNSFIPFLTTAEIELAESNWDALSKSLGITLTFTDLITIRGLEYGFKQAARFAADNPQVFTRAASTMKGLSKVFGWGSLIISAFDGFHGGMKGHHYAQITGDVLAILYSPFGVVWAVGNLISFMANGNSLSENISDWDIHAISNTIDKYQEVFRNRK